MEQSLRMNADRFTGFADIYDHARPACPEKVKEILISYLGRTPACVVDMGCGTGLSTITWSEVSQKIIGIEPSADMLAVAKEKAAALDNVDFISTFSNETGLANDSVDIITCSQSFHWMDPESTLKEAGRILKSGGVFAAYDCDWPPICSWEAELAYNELFEKVSKIELAHTEIKNSFVK